MSWRFIDNLQRKYNNNKKGSSFAGLKGMAVRAQALKRPSPSRNGTRALSPAWTCSRSIPGTLTRLDEDRQGLAGLGCYDVQLYFLRLALDSIPIRVTLKSIANVPRRLRSRGTIRSSDDLLGAGKEASPNNEEAQSAIADRSMPIKWSTSRARRKACEPARRRAESKAGTREDELRERLDADPADVGAASELADIFARDENYHEAEKTLARITRSDRRRHQGPRESRRHAAPPRPPS